MIGKPSRPVRREAARKRTSTRWHLAARPTHPPGSPRTAAWPGYERDPALSEAMIRWAAINTMTRRIARGGPVTRPQRREFSTTS